MDEQTAKAIVRIFSIFGFVGGALSVIFGILVAVFGSTVANLLVTLGMPDYGALAGSILLALSAAPIVAGAVAIIIAWGLWKLKKWARITEGIGGILSLPGFPAGTIIGIVIIYFFLINKDIARACSK